MAVADTARLLASLELDNRKFLSGVRGSLGALGKLDKGIGQSAAKIGKGFAKAGAVAAGLAVGGFALSAKAAIDWEEAFQGVVKTVDEADLSKAGLTFDDLRESIRGMAREMPISANALAGIAEQAGALGIKAGDIESFTRQVAILASTTDVSADQAATALGQLQNVIGLTGSEFDNFAAALVDLGNKGASTESQILEIARRSGGAAHLIELGKDATLGWASAAANLGINQELAGTSLQNFYLKALKAVEGGDSLRDMAKIAGQSGKEFKKSFDEDASGSLERFLTGLGKMDKDARLDAVQNLFGKGSGLTRLVLGLAESVDENLTPSLDTSAAAWKKATAAQLEFEKRNQTVRSAITRLKNNLVDAAITVGEGFAPALGEAADSLSKFLQQKENREELKNIGKELGAALKSINWDTLANGAKGLAKAFKPALDIVLRIAEAISKLPPEVIGVGGAAILADRFSGGAISSGIGGVIGGLGSALAKSLAASIPVFGKAFVQPVFVTNPGFGVGGVPGIGGGGKGGLLKLIPLIGEALILGEVVNAVREEIGRQSTEQARGIQATLASNVGQMSNDDLIAALNGVNQGINDLQSNPLNVLVQGEALTTLQQMQTELQARLRENGGPLRNESTIEHRAGERQSGETDVRGAQKIGNGFLVERNVKNMEARLADLVSAGKGNSTKSEQIRARLADANARLTELKSQAVTAINSGTSATQIGFAGTAATVRGTTGAVTSAQGAIVAAIQGIPAPVINLSVSPTSVEKNNTVINRYGPTTGSHGGGGGNGSIRKID